MNIPVAAAAARLVAPRFPTALVEPCACAVAGWASIKTIEAAATRLKQTELATRPAALARMSLVYHGGPTVRGIRRQPTAWRRFGRSPRNPADLGSVARRAPGQLLESLPMIDHEVRSHKSSEALPREEQLAWKLAEVATDPVPVEAEVAEMVVNRLIDDAGVAAAALRRRPVANARAQALRHALSSGGTRQLGRSGRSGRAGATVFGCPHGMHVQPEWAAWANCVAVRELDFHDTFLAAEYSHPGDNIPPLLAVAQHAGCSGHDLVRAIATAYEVQVDLCRGISLHAHRIDHVAHLGPSVAAGTGTLLGLPTEVVYQAIGQALHTTTATRQSRKGAISTWKAYAPSLRRKGRH